MKILPLFIFIIVIALLCGCASGGGSGGDTETVTIKTEPLTCKPIFYGDSITAQFMKAINAPDFIYDAVGGRAVTHLLIEGPATTRHETVIDYDACHIYIALGTNNRFAEELNELHFIQLIEGYRDKITCVLPMTWAGEMIPFREVMLRECTSIIDPLQFGVLPLGKDGIHLNNASPENAVHYASIFTDAL